MELPNQVELTKREGDLSLYSYTQDAEHPSPASFWKGVVMDGEHMVARSYQWSPSVVTEDSELPRDMLYTRYHEATIIRFYKHDGKPMVSTHSQIDITNKKSRVGTGKPFMELIKDAISAWEYVEGQYDTPRGKGLEFTPKSWQELCTDGWVHVYLLVDQSNQMTDLEDLTEVYEVDGQDEEFTVPKLLYALSFRDEGDALVPKSDPFVIPVHNDPEYQEYTMAIPTVERLSYPEAQQEIMEGRAVIGHRPAYPDVATKFLSHEYARKLWLAGETFNVVHRWHELMDHDEDLATEYLDIIPWHKKDITLAHVSDAYLKYLGVSINYLADIIASRVHSEKANVPQKLYKLLLTDDKAVCDLITETVRKFHRNYRRRITPPKDVINKKASMAMVEYLKDISYTKLHTLHGLISKANAGYLK